MLGGLIALLSVFYGTISVVAVVGNSLVMWIVATSRRIQNVTNCFIANLALADIVIGLFAIPFQMTVGVGGVCSLTSEVLNNLNKDVTPPTYFDWRDWFRAGLPFFRGDMTLRCSALIFPHGSR
ncbi:neuropeptide Y receptor activity protein [Homalodisca vitripennis]|nr:neuropeptide Y receptor activity protein [Homalodisca vitripennis]